MSAQSASASGSQGPTSGVSSGAEAAMWRVYGPNGYAGPTCRKSASIGTASSSCGGSSPAATSSSSVRRWTRSSRPRGPLPQRVAGGEPPVCDPQRCSGRAQPCASCIGPASRGRPSTPCAPDPRCSRCSSPSSGATSSKCPTRRRGRRPGEKDTRFGWHQDGRFRRPASAYRDLGGLMQTFVAIDRHDRENGCLKLVRGSHLARPDRLADGLQRDGPVERR